MAAGRPIVAAVNAESETGRFIRSKEVGIVVPPEDPTSLAKAFRALRANPGQSRTLGSNGRNIALSQFDRSIVLERIEKEICQRVRN